MHRLLGGLLTFAWALPALAQSLEVVPVPQVPLDPTVPHFALNGRATTFKAIARGGNGTYLVEWDYNGDGTYDSSATTTNRYDLSARSVLPNQTSDVTFQAKVRVTSAGQTVVGNYPVRVFSGVPTTVAAMSERQLRIAQQAAIDDGLWYLHRQIARTGDESNPLTGAQATGTLSPLASNNALALEAFEVTGHHVAFAPASYLGTMNDPASNAQRWQADPYAEDAMRLTNRLLGLLQPVAVATNPANTQNSPNDESNATGVYPERVEPPLGSTDNGIGLYVGAGSASNGDTHTTLRAFARSRNAGFTAQVGDAQRVLGRPLTHITQELVDAVVWSQNESGAAPGSWYYTPNTNNDWLSEFHHGTHGALEALAAAERRSADGVIVPNIAKSRAVSGLLSVQRTCAAGGVGAGPSIIYSACDFTKSAAVLFGYAWAGAAGFDSQDGRLAFPGYFNLNNPTRGQLRNNYDSSVRFISTVFTKQVPGGFSWDMGFAAPDDAGVADFTRTDGLGCTAAMLHWTRAARQSNPPIQTFSGDAGVFDHRRLFSTYLLGNQQSTGAWVTTQSNQLNCFSDTSNGPLFPSVYALLTLAADVPEPIAQPLGPQTVAEGSQASFTAQGGVPDELTYAWVFSDAGVASGAQANVVFQDDGPKSVTLTVTNAAGTADTQTLQVTVSNVAPTADAGPDVVIREGDAVTLRGSAFDPGADGLSFVWQLQDAGVSGQTITRLFADNGTFTALLTVTDDDNGAGTDSAQVTVTNVSPTITSSPPLTASVAQTMAYTLTFTDPGTADTHTCSAPLAPSGATLTGCALSWVPSVAQASQTLPFSLCVTDDDSGRTCQSFFVAVGPAPIIDAGTADAGVVDAGAIDAGMVNRSPTVPRLDMPAFGASVSSLTPTLSVGNAADADRDALTYEFEVRSSVVGPVVARAASIAEGTGTTSWVVSAALTEDATYYWRARAADASGPGPWTELGRFTVNTSNATPSAPAIVSPVNGSTVATLTPTFAFLAVADADGDRVVFDWELATEASFATPIVSSMDMSSMHFTAPSALSEDSRYCWRVRADDGQATSEWTTACFVVSVTDGAPATPVLVSPVDGATVTTLSPVFSWQPVSDPEGKPVTYTLEVSSAGAVISTTTVSGTLAVLASPLEDGAAYAWRVRAKTATGETEGATSTDATLSVKLPTTATPKSGCDVSAAPLFLGLALLLGARRRR